MVMVTRMVENGEGGNGGGDGREDINDKGKGA